MAGAPITVESKLLLPAISTCPPSEAFTFAVLVTRAISEECCTLPQATAASTNRLPPCTLTSVLRTVPTLDKATEMWLSQIGASSVSISGPTNTPPLTTCTLLPWRDKTFALSFSTTDTWFLRSGACTLRAGATRLAPSMDRSLPAVARSTFAECRIDRLMRAPSPTGPWAKVGTSECARFPCMREGPRGFCSRIHWRRASRASLS
mmetsp:Transcript_39475/g.109786  ORF Transcript_39475/g.109786 Transcript_39475/m.109786 type:complete len:206 (-) Transcript_39475:1835-2452(-)